MLRTYKILNRCALNYNIKKYFSTDNNNNNKSKEEEELKYRFPDISDYIYDKRISDHFNKSLKKNIKSAEQSDNLSNLKNNLKEIKKIADTKERMILDYDKHIHYEEKDAILKENPQFYKGTFDGVTLPDYDNININNVEDDDDLNEDIEKIRKYLEMRNSPTSLKIRDIIKHHDQARTDQAATFVSMMKAGCHYGARDNQLHPFMSKYIFCSRFGQHIFDISKSLAALRRLMFLLQELVIDDCRILFVGNSPVARDIVEEYAQKCDTASMVGKWTEGTLYNYNRLSFVSRGLRKFSMEKHSNADVSEYLRRVSMFRSLDGPPDFFVLLNRKGNESLIHEANIFKIPVACLCDSDTSPSKIMYVLPGNDDSSDSIRYFMKMMSNAISEVKDQIKSRKKKLLFENEKKEKLNKISKKVRSRLDTRHGLLQVDLLNPRRRQKKTVEYSNPIINKKKDDNEDMYLNYLKD